MKKYLFYNLSMQEQALEMLSLQVLCKRNRLKIAVQFSMCGTALKCKPAHFRDFLTDILNQRDRHKLNSKQDKNNGKQLPQAAVLFPIW